ncbi:MAG: hypothetical protein JWP12_713 [Bacteroidetes bacterium]|nr:hypothetical protein [Bacteroidota bacterium]
MKKLISFFFIIFIFNTVVSAQTDTIRINGIKFITVKQTVKNIDFDDKKDTVLKFYRMENGKAKYLLSHYLHAYSADCNNEFTDIGSYKIQNDSLIFITKYLQKTGLDPIPVMRKQIYKADAKGRLSNIYDWEQQRSGEWVEVQSNH